MGFPILARSAEKAAPSALPWVSIQNKTCGYYLRYPKASTLERLGACTLKVILPPFQGQEWIQEASLTLEVTAAENGVATESPVDGGEPTGSLVAGGMKFEKTTEGDAGAGHTFITVSYTAVGKKHQYHFVGILSATNPQLMEGQSAKDWDPQKSAEKIFDGLVLTFRPM
jgi:hypothetical protein